MHTRATGWWVWAWVSCLCAAPASAHAPLPRALAVSPSGAAVSVALPGFGLLIRSGADREFRYACDALLGVPASDTPVVLQYFDDDTLLLGSPAGLRRVAASGCPLEPIDPTLELTPIVALAIHPATQVAYVIASGYAGGVWRSSDRGIHWERRGPFPEPDRVSGFALDPADPARLFVTRGAGEASTLLVSSDAGGSFVSVAQERAIRVLAMQAAPQRLWAVARAQDSVGNRGFSILRAPEPDGVWGEVLRVNYFGGLSITRGGEVWVGDEGGGVYRSTDSGDSFVQVDARTRAACLASESDAVLACTPGLPTAPALQALEPASAPARPVVAFTDVETLVECGATLAETRCGAAWVEWQRDVLMRDLTADAGAGAAPDAGNASPDALPPAAPADAVQDVQSSAGCSIAAHRAEHLAGVVWVLVCAALARTLRRRTQGGGHCASEAKDETRGSRDCKEDR